MAAFALRTPEAIIPQPQKVAIRGSLASEVRQTPVA
jgi:hypothetical protein